jgi:hypothetical protein
MIIWHDPNLARVFREEVARHFDKIQEVALANNASDN